MKDGRVVAETPRPASIPTSTSTCSMADYHMLTGGGANLNRQKGIANRAMRCTVQPANQPTYLIRDSSCCEGLTRMGSVVCLIVRVMPCAVGRRELGRSSGTHRWSSNPEGAPTEVVWVPQSG